MRRKSAAGNSARSSSAAAAGTTSASTKRATLLRNSSCSGVNAIMSAPLARALERARRRVVDGQLRIHAGDDDAVLLACGRDRHDVVQDVLEHRARFALERIAVAAGAGLLERDDVAVLEFA